jgi:hypothetical protein
MWPIVISGENKLHLGTRVYSGITLGDSGELVLCSTGRKFTWVAIYVKKRLPRLMIIELLTYLVSLLD